MLKSLRRRRSRDPARRGLTSWCGTAVIKTRFARCVNRESRPDSRNAEQGRRDPSPDTSGFDPDLPSRLDHPIMNLSTFDRPRPSRKALPCRPLKPHPSIDPGRVVQPELLSPAGDRTCLIAAIENGADAVYFGLRAHNARARAVNFDLSELPEVIDLLHRRGVKGYVTLNTLAFPRELDDLETTVRVVAEAGVDALIVQDVGLARLIRAITPDLEIHASTQMSVTSAEGVRLAKELGCSRVILARELSLREIAQDSLAKRPATGRGLRPRGPLCRLFRPVSDQRGPRRPIGQPGRMRPGLPAALRDRLRRRAPATSTADQIPAQPPGPRRL